MQQKKSLLIAGIVILTFSMAASAAAGQIDDCRSFSEHVTQLVEESVKTRGFVYSGVVKKLEIEYPHVERNRLQMYIATTAANWASSMGNRIKVFEKTVDNCHRLH